VFACLWQRAPETPITLPMNAKYRPDVGQWVHTSQHFDKSQFLVCKHLVQDVHAVSPVFFLQQTLQYSVRAEEDNRKNTTGVEGNVFDREDEEAEDEFVDTEAGWMDTCTFQEHFKAHITNLCDFCDGLQYQIQFKDHKMLHAIECDGASFICLMERCLGQERRDNLSWQRCPTTWERETSKAMFYRICLLSTASDEST
ncbi:hypothetical protein BDR03DRAFT_880936, partial [Suillus americanus]